MCHPNFRQRVIAHKASPLRVVAIGPVGTSGFDFVRLDFPVARTVAPEPTPLITLLAGASLLDRRRRLNDA